MATQQHFLVVVVGIQGQINPARDLARQITRHTSARVTIATPISSHRRMFPNSPPIIDHGRISFAAYSDGFDAGFHPDTDDNALFASRLKTVGAQTLTQLANDLSARGRPVTCIAYSILLAWAADVAKTLRIPSVLYWVQPASLFTIYYHYFHTRPDIVVDDPSFQLALPGLPPLRTRDLPSILLNQPNPFADVHAEIFEVVDKETKPKVLVNTFYALERDVIESMQENHGVNLIPIGPMMDKNNENVSLSEEDKSEYIQWLDSKDDNSIVYVSFGSLSRLSKRQMEEILLGLERSGKHYLWVVRRDSREGVTLSGGEKGMIVEWCDQVKVLSHRAVGCFVTHGGWNSTLESVSCGVPMVVVPQWLDQTTNARLVGEEGWGVGVRGEGNEEGVVEGREVERCVGVVMGNGEKGVEIRRKAEMWSEKAHEASKEGGAYVRSLVDFVNGI